MKKLFILCLTCFLNSLFSFSQDSSRFYETIDTLCSSYFYGRAYINKGHEKTAEYLINRLNGADTSYFQEFKFDLNVLKEEALILDEEALVGGLDFILVPQSRGVNNIEYSTLYLDSAFFWNRKKIKKLLKKDISSNAIVFNIKWESRLTDLPDLRKKIYTQAGCLIKLTDGELLSSFSQNAWMPPSFLLKADRWTGQKKVFANLIQEVKEISSNNVVALIKGKNPDLKELLITAHYDHVGGFKTIHIPGANDNASGVAMMLELYEFFIKNKPERTIRFIAFGAEEVGLLGSDYYVKNMDKSSVEFVLNLDLLGAGSGGVTVVNGTVFTFYTDKLKEVNQVKGYVKKIKLRGEAANSDHFYFSKNGIPAFFIYTNGSVGGYHNVNDVPSELERGYFEAVFFLLKDFCLSI